MSGKCLPCNILRHSAHHDPALVSRKSPEAVEPRPLLSHPAGILPAGCVATANGDAVPPLGRYDPNDSSMPPPQPPHPQHTLAIDIGGSGLKATVLDAGGQALTERVRIDTPVGATPPTIVAALVALASRLPEYHRAAVGFPGMVRHGVVLTAPNLGHDGWRGYHLAEALAAELGVPTRVANDADVQGFAAIRGQGLELVITLGTGFGTALYEDGRLCPHLEISQQPFRCGETYDQQLGDATRRKIGNRKWRRRVHRAIANLRTMTHFDHLYLGGGNSRRFAGRKLPPDVSLVDNAAGLLGGAFLWRDEVTALPGGAS